MDRLQQYQNNGFITIPDFLSVEQMDALKAELTHLSGVAPSKISPELPWYDNMLERAPELMWPILSDARVMAFLESVMGPLVQLDNLTLASMPSGAPGPDGKGTVNGWHRDRWSRMPLGYYAPPFSMNMIVYLQDMSERDGAYGPLRVIPGSHIEPVEIAEDCLNSPHPDEVLVMPKAGAAVITHAGLLHSGTGNISGLPRYFFSVYYNLSWMRTTDNHAGPNCQHLLRQAQQRNDRRAMRLLGADPMIEARANAGFTQADQWFWEQWQREDAEALREPVSSSI